MPLPDRIDLGRRLAAAGARVKVRARVGIRPSVTGKVAVLSNPDNNSHAAQITTMLSEARSIGKEVLPVEARSRKELEAGFASMARQRADAVILLGDTFFADRFRTIADLARGQRLPAAHASREFVTAGGFMSYEPNFADNFRRAAVYLDKLLKGANPAEMPFEQPTQYYLVINLETAKVLGVTVPQSLLVRADEVIR